MKLFLTGLLVLASVSATSIAAAATETLIFAPSPQPCTKLTGCTATELPDAEKVKQNITERYQYINGTRAMGVVINGNFTLSGTSDEFNQSDELLKNFLPAVPHFVGLGNNEYWENNKITGIYWLNRHVTYYIGGKLPGDLGLEPSFNFQLRDGSQGAGSFGYAVPVGKDKRFYLIHLNDPKAIKSEIVDGRIQTFSAADWLRSSMEYAAQSEKRGEPRKIIIVSSHRSDVGSDIAQVLDDYEVNLRFSSETCTPNSDVAINAFYCLPYSAEKMGEKLYQLDLDSVTDKFKLSKVVVTGGSGTVYTRTTTELLAGSVAIHYPLQEIKGYYGARPWVFSVKNEGTYTIKNIKVSYDLRQKEQNPLSPSCTYVSESPVKVECNSGKQYKGNIYMLVIPTAATNVSAQAFQFGDVNWLPFFQRNGLIGEHAKSDNLEKDDPSLLSHTTRGRAGSISCDADRLYIDRIEREQPC